MEQFLQILSSLMTPAVVLAGLIGSYYTIRNQVSNIVYRLQAFESEIVELRKVVVSLARQEERVSSMDQRMMAQGQRIDAQAERITTLDQRTMTLTAKIDGLIAREKR